MEDLNEDLIDPQLEKFYVFRSINLDESWGALTLDCNSLRCLPNIDFGMRVFAKNEKAAIARGKAEYDKLHAHDSEKENIREFASSALRGLAVYNKDIDILTDLALRASILMSAKFNEYFEGKK